jgi:transcriptional regulator with XRE-family HTH domain
MGYNDSRRVKSLKERREQGMNIKALAESMEAKRVREGISIRTAGVQARVPFSTFAHIARQAGRIPDIDTLEKICAWLGHPVSRYLVNLPHAEDVIVIYPDGASLPDTIDIVLSNDPNLDPQALQTLSHIFHEAYDYHVLRNAMQPTGKSATALRPAKSGRR